MPGGIVIAYDAMKNRNIQEFRDIITDVLKREDMIQEANTITVLGVLDKVLHPSKFLCSLICVPYCILHSMNKLTLKFV